MDKLNKKNIFPRRYFYPSLNKFKEILEYKECPISEDIASRILCLPLYFDLKTEDIELISNLVLKANLS